MKLIDFMREQKLTDAAMAALVGSVSAHGIRKVKYGERSPSLSLAIRIENATGGKVTPADLLMDREPAPEAAE